jgi:hypothetical protein
MAVRPNASRTVVHYQEQRARRCPLPRHPCTGQNLHITCYERPMRLHDYAPRPAQIKWLLDSDPAIRWQVMSDLTDASPDAIAAERSRIATKGWGAQLLAAQSLAGYWGDPRKWDLVTRNSLVALKDLGLDPASVASHK